MIAPWNIDAPSTRGRDVGASGWRTVTQDDVDPFTEATGDHFAMNHGLNRVRFGGSLPVGDRVRMPARLDAESRAGEAGLTATLTFARASGDRPVCVAEFLIHLQP